MGRAVAAIPVLLQALANDALELGDGVLAELAERRRRCVADLVDRLGRRVAPEREATRSFPSACSGLMYGTVPITTPAWVRISVLSSMS